MAGLDVGTGKKDIEAVTKINIRWAGVVDIGLAEQLETHAQSKNKKNN